MTKRGKEDMHTHEPILKSAIDVFTEINERINSLIDCSARDFDILNANFKEYHGRIKSLAQITGGALNEILQLSDKDLESVGQMLDKDDKLIRDLTEYAKDLVRSLMQFDKGISYAFLYTNNLKQNSYTLKLLTTNLQFEPKSGKLYKEIIGIIDELISCVSNLEHVFINIEKRNLMCSTSVERIIEYQIPALLQVEARFSDELKILTEKKLKSKDYKTALDKLTSESTLQSSEIITNLQFQDITRQKIEHVHTAYETLLASLKDIYAEKKDSPEQSWNLSIELLTRIRDIGSLQAAQLMHANHEYQGAVENITNKFGVLDETMTETLNLLQKLTGTGKNNEDISLRQIEKVLSHLELEKDTLLEENKELQHALKDLLKKKENLLDSKNKIDCILNNIGVLMDKLTPLSNLGTTKNTTVSPPIFQLLQGIEEFRINAVAMDELVSRDKLNLGLINEEIVEGHLRLFSGIKDNGEHLHKIAQALIGTTNQNENMPDYKPKDRHNLTSEISLGQVKYYKVFEKEMEDIISKINNFVNKINFDDIEKDSSKEDIEKLKKLYTMNSERKVHNIYTGNTDKSEINEDDIELF